MQKSKVLHRSRTKQTLNHTRRQSTSTVTEKKEFDSKLYEKFVNFLTRTRLQKLKQKITYFYGRNFPIEYQQKFNFLEEWQGLEKKQEKNLNDLIQSENTIIQIVCLFIMLSNTVIVWNITVERVFRTQGEISLVYMPILILAIINRLVSASLRVHLESLRSENGLAFKRTLRIVAKDILCLIYCLLGLFGVLYYNPLTVLLEIIISIYLFLQARKYYKYLRILELSLVYQYQFKIFDLMINLIIVAHFLSILLYMGTLYDASNNWIVSLHGEVDSYLSKYLYSFYFCSTTILTIGYGDITPKNKVQYIIVIVVQFIGVIIFGYLISQISHTLSIIRKNEENLQKDLATLKKIESFYQLQTKLVNRAKGFLVSNQNALVQLTPDQENNLLAKLNEELRTVIINEKSLSIVKTSIFFLCRWSKDMQTHVASKLQKALYAPNERLLQPVNKERIYIIKRGKIEIYCDRFGHNRREYRRLMKTIKVLDGNTISQNIYGYTAVLSLRPSALDAISSEFTSCYYIEKNQFLKCVHSCEVDEQYYHEIKSRIDQSEFCQAYQAPSIMNIRQHYNPSRTILIRKTKAQLSKLRSDRELFLRCQKRRVKKHYFKTLPRIIEQINDKLIYNSNDYIEYSNKNEYPDQLGKKGSQKSIEQQTIRCASKEAKRTNTLIRTTEIMNLSSINISGSKTDIFLPLVKKSFHHYFQRAQQYKNFFCNNNLSKVIERLENENYNFRQKQEQCLSYKMYTNKQINFGFNNHNGN